MEMFDDEWDEHPTHEIYTLQNDTVTNGITPSTPYGKEIHTVTNYTTSLYPVYLTETNPITGYDILYYTNDLEVTWQWKVESLERSAFIAGMTDRNEHTVFAHGIPFDTEVGVTFPTYIGQDILIDSARFVTQNVLGVIYECVGYELQDNTNTPWTVITNENSVLCNFQVNSSTERIAIAKVWENVSYYLDVSASNGIIVNPFNSYNVNEWKDVNSGGQIYAQPFAQYEFSHWSGDIPLGQETANPATIFMDKGRRIVANFKKTNPTEPTIANINADNSFYFEWESELNTVYEVQCSTNLPDWNTLTTVTGTGTTMSYTDNRDLDKAFYRLRAN
jgi:hypothetical protein